MLQALATAICFGWSDHCHLDPHGPIHSRSYSSTQHCSLTSQHVASQRAQVATASTQLQELTFLDTRIHSPVYNCPAQATKPHSVSRLDSSISGPARLPPVCLFSMRHARSNLLTAHHSRPTPTSFHKSIPFVCLYLAASEPGKALERWASRHLPLIRGSFHPQGSSFATISHLLFWNN